MPILHRLKVLSIDYDYFSNVDAETIAHCYPDGVDLTSQLSMYVWANRYSELNGQKAIMDSIKNSELLLHSIHKVLWDQQRTTKCVIANSHRHIYQAIESMVRPGQGIDIDHIDFHHDCREETTDEIDCGNWCRVIMNDHPGTCVTWFTRLAGYDAQQKPNDLYKLLPIVQFDTLDMIQKKNYDLVFICRSDAWTPPHLDKQFEELVTICSAIFSKVDCQVCVSKPRDMEVVLSMAQQVDEAFQTMQKEGVFNHADRHTTS